MFQNILALLSRTEDDIFLEIQSVLREKCPKPGSDIPVRHLAVVNQAAKLKLHRDGTAEASAEVIDDIPVRFRIGGSRAVIVRKAAKSIRDTIGILLRESGDCLRSHRRGVVAGI